MQHFWKILRSDFKRILTIFLVANFILSILIDLMLLPTGKSRIFSIGFPSKMVRYAGKSFPFFITYPENWRVLETPTGVQGNKEVITVISPAMKSVPCVVIEERKLQDATIEMVIRWRIEKVQDLQKYTVISTKTFERSGQQYYLHDYTWEGWGIFSSPTVACREYAFARNDKGYSIEVCAESEHWKQYGDIFQSILDSFVIP